MRWRSQSSQPALPASRERMFPCLIRKARRSAETGSDFRLPKTVTPRRYEIRLIPDLTQFTFAGDESVAIVVNSPTSEIVLNALELEIDRVSAERGKTSLNGQGRTRSRKRSARFCASIARWKPASGRCISRFAASSTTSCMAFIGASIRMPPARPTPLRRPNSNRPMRAARSRVGTSRN